jgi:hypothetical protein
VLLSVSLLDLFPLTPVPVAEFDTLVGARLDLHARAFGLDGPCGPGADEAGAAATMSILMTGLHRLRSWSLWEELWSVPASSDLVLFSQLVVTMVRGLF